MTAAAKPGLLDAILAVQAEAPTLTKNAKNPHFGNRYADMGEIAAKVGPVLAANGLVWIVKPSYDAQTGEPTLRYRMAHVPSGESDEGEMKLFAKPDAQGQGSGITYARRYALVAYLNLIADDDDDGNAASHPAPARVASDKQRTFLKRLKTQNRITDHEMGVMMKGAGLVISPGDTLDTAMGRLTSAQASALIDEIQQGALPTGESDVPAAGGDDFKHEPAGEVPQELDLGPS